MRLLTLFLILLLMILLYTLFFGKNGIVDYNGVTADIAVQEQVNQSLKERNALIFAEVDDLTQGLDAIEEKARNELGMIKENETFYRIIGDNSEQNATFNSEEAE